MFVCLVQGKVQSCESYEIGILEVNAHFYQTGYVKLPSSCLSLFPIYLTPKAGLTQTSLTKIHATALWQTSALCDAGGTFG